MAPTEPEHPKGAVSLTDIAEAAKAGAAKRKESPDATLAKIVGIPNRKARRALRHRARTCPCGARVKAANWTRHAAKCRFVAAAVERYEARRAESAVEGANAAT